MIDKYINTIGHLNRDVSFVVDFFRALNYTHFVYKENKETYLDNFLPISKLPKLDTSGGIDMKIHKNKDIVFTIQNTQQIVLLYNKETPQSKAESAIETMLNTLSGIILSLAVWNYWVLLIPYYGVERGSGAGTGLAITLTFTVVSIFRSYIWRRLFADKYIHKAVHYSYTKYKQLKDIFYA